MKKFIILIAVFLFANVINKEVLLIEAKLYPKIIMLIKNFQNKDTIKVAIIANDNTFYIAKTLKQFIKNKKLKIDILRHLDLEHDVYILTYKLDKNIIEKLIKNKKIIFSVFSEDIDISMFSIYIGPRIYPYINPKLIKKANIQINPILFKVGKIYE